MADTAVAESGPLMTADGRPLKASLQRSLRQNKLRAAGLVATPALFLIVFFLIPVAYLLFKSVDDSDINSYFPRVFAEFHKWDKKDLPPESMYKAMFDDIVNADGIEIGKGSTRMNYSQSGWKSLMKKSRRKFKKIKEGPYKEAMIRPTSGGARRSTGSRWGRCRTNTLRHTTGTRSTGSMMKTRM